VRKSKTPWPKATHTPTRAPFALGRCATSSAPASRRNGLVVVSGCGRPWPGPPASTDLSTNPPSRKESDAILRWRIRFGLARRHSGSAIQPRSWSFERKCRAAISANCPLGRTHCHRLHNSPESRYRLQPGLSVIQERTCSTLSGRQGSPKIVLGASSCIAAKKSVGGFRDQQKKITHRNRYSGTTSVGEFRSNRSLQAAALTLAG
jgi:hypothetical protein